MIKNAKMAEMILNYKGKRLKYFINLQTKQHVQDQTVENILKYYPSDIEIEFNELY